MKKLKILFNLITLALTTGLLVMITVAWYAVNKTASVTDGTGSVADIEKILDTAEYYNFQSVSNNVYTVKQYVKHAFGDNEDRTQIRYYENNGTQIASPDTSGNQGYDGNFKMNEFDYLKQDVSKYLIKLTLKPGKSLGSLQFLSTASYFIGFSNGSGDGSVTNVSGLSMSSVIKFGQLTTAPTIGNLHSTVTITNEPSDDINVPNHYEHFDYTNNDGFEYHGAITTTKKTIVGGMTPATENDSVVIYLLIDYNVDALNAFYGYNLSTSSRWSNPSAPQFTSLDFKIFLLG